MSDAPDWLVAARAHWRWRGDDRPPFADPPAPKQESVWDYPRPPRIVPDSRTVRVMWDEREIACTRAAFRVLETGHPPSFYLPLHDVDRRYLEAAAGSSMCEWKGPARYWNLRDGDRVLTGVGWSYPHPFDGAEALADCIAFYPTDLACSVDGDPVRPQPGGFYGGWITAELAGPFKGVPGSAGW